MTRAYIRLDPAFDERKHDYPDGAYAALVATLCLAEAQSERGRFRSERYLRALLEKRGRWIAYMLDHGDLAALPDGRLYVVGWDEWQEGDVTVRERMENVRRRRGDVASRTSGAVRTAQWRLRQQVFERDAYTCRYCGRDDYERDWLVTDHIIPAPHGQTTLANLATACRPCNKLKGARTPDQAGMPLLPVTRHGDTSRTSRDSDALPSDSGTKRSGTKQSAAPVTRNGGLTAALPDDKHAELLDGLAATLEGKGVLSRRKGAAYRPATDEEIAERARAVLADESAPAWKRDAARAQLEVMGLA